MTRALHAGRPRSGAAAATLVVHELPDGATIEEMRPPGDAAGERPGVRAAGSGGWLRSATAWTLDRTDAWAPSLLAFLVRGGIVALALPILVLPTPIGIASFVGADAITAAGPTDRFIALAVTAAALSIGALVAGMVVGAAADRVVLRWWSADALRDRPAATAGTARTVGRLVATRLVGLIPLAAASAWAAPRIADAVYRELVLPADLATPLVIRAVATVPEAFVVLCLAFLFGELVGGLSAVHVVADGSSGPRALVRSGRDLVLHPASVLAAFALGVALLLVVVGLPLALATLAWGWVRDAFLDGAGPVAVAVPVLLLVGGWVLALAGAGAAGAWRRASIASIVAAGERR